MKKRLTMFMMSLFLCVGSMLAQTKVSGTVLSQEDVPAGSNQLEVTYLGYEGKTVTAKNGMRIFLKADAKLVDEVIVVAYGTAKKSSFTGSAAAISSEKIASRPVTNVTKALDGQVSGVTVTSGSGQPGSGASIVIRGFGSINASNNPLYVVDGIPFDGALNSINPQDIESMTVLKDASASALYGSRAANGVVIITTKKGKEGKAQVTLHNTVGWSWRALPKYDLVNQEEYAELTFESLRNGYMYTNGLSYEDATNAAMANMGSKLGSELYNPYKNYTWATLIDPATGKVKADAQSKWDENWMDPLYVKGAFRHEHNLSINGGTDKTNYMISLGYVNEDGILKTTGFQRYSARANVDSQVTDWFKAGLNTNLSYTKSSYNQYSDTSTSNPWYTAQFSNPLYPLYEKDAQGNTIYDSFGNPQLDYGENGRPVAADHNPLGGLVNDKSWTNRDNAGVRTYVTFGSDKENFGWAQGLKFTVSFGADYSGLTETEMMNKFHGNQKNAGGLIQKYATRDLSYTFNQQLTYNRKFGDHTIGALLGHEFYQYTYNYLYAGKTNIVDGINELRPASTIYDADSYSIEHDIEAYFGSLNYNFAEKYYLSAHLRRDGSSRFHKDHRWGTFWGVGANWRISAENFMKNVSWVDNLSLRASYGENGNEGLEKSGQQNYYAWQNLYSLAYPNGNKIGGFVSTLENKDLSWEKNGMFDVALEGALLGNRIRFSVEYFNKKTTDMLLNYPMALSTGFTGYDANVGNMRNWGWEFMVSGTLLKTKNVVWNLTWMGTAQKNKVLKLTEQSNEIINGVYESMDDDGNVTGEYITDDYAKAATSKYFVGKRTPDLYGSISTDLTLFNCVDLSILTTYSLGGKIYDSLYYGTMKPMYYANDTWNKNVLRRWQKPGDITDIPRVDVGGSSTLTSNYLVNASYFAIKNITLGYTLPSSIATKAYLSSLRVYASFDNVALFTHLKGMDPQYNLTGGTNYAYSPNKTFSIGLDINF